MRVVDDEGVPYVNQRVLEVWRHYSLELDGGGDEEERWTDNDGRVEFPRRTIRMSFSARTARSAFAELNRFLHGSAGVHAYLMASGPVKTISLYYEPDKTPPDKLVLPRHEKNDKNP